MIKNYFLVAIRNFVRNKIFSIVNVIGLSISLSVFLVILQYVRHERSFDHFNLNSDRLYRVDHTFLNDGQVDFQSARTYPSIGPRLMTEFQEVMNYCRLFKKYRPCTVTFEDKNFKEENIFYADSSFFNVFSYPLVAGDPGSALSKAMTAIIEEKVASNLFGSENPIGKRITMGSMDGTEEFEITGVFQNPENSHLQMRVIGSYASLINLFGDEAHTSWGWYDFYTYIVLQEHASAANLESKLVEFVRRHDGTAEGKGPNMRLNLRKVSDIYLNSSLMMEASVNGDQNTVNMLFALAIVIQIIAWINYIIFATVRAFERAKEVGLRKVVGSSRIQLAFQFITESVMMGFLAAIVCVVLLYFLVPIFVERGATWISFEIFHDPIVWLSVLGIVLTGSILSGIYPAFILSALKPVTVLKGSIRSSGMGIQLRRILIGIQFSATIVLVIGILVIDKQLSFLNSIDTGFNDDHLLIVRAPDVINNRNQYAQSLQSFKESALNLSGVNSASLTSDVPGSPVSWYNGAQRLSTETTYPPRIVYTMTVDDSFLSTYQIRMVAGRFYSEMTQSDSQTVVLNEQGILALGFHSAEEGLENKIRMRGDTLRIIGVVQNYYHESPKVPIKPTAYLQIPDEKLYFSIRYASTDLPPLIDKIRATYNSIFPGSVFDHALLEDSYDQQYQAEAQQLIMFKGFGSVAVILACTGLFALTSYTIIQRVKEIGVRKVLGASDIQIFNLFAWETIHLILASNVVAIPVGVYLLNKWLEQFANKTFIDAGIIALAALLTLTLAFIAIAYNAMRAAHVKPAKYLKNE